MRGGGQRPFEIFLKIHPIWQRDPSLYGSSFCEVDVETAIGNDNRAHDEDELNNDDEVNNDGEVNNEDEVNDDEHHIGLNGVVALGLGGGDNRMG